MAKLKPLFRVTYKGLPKLEKKFENMLVQDTMRYIAFMWWRDFRPLHFTTAGARRYHYAARKTKNVFTGQPKRKKSGKPRAPDGRPLVWTGESMRSSQQKRIDSKPKWSSVVMPVRKLNFKPKGNKTLNMPGELKKVLKSEITTLEKEGTKYLTDLLNKHAAPATVTIRA